MLSMGVAGRGEYSRGLGLFEELRKIRVERRVYSTASTPGNMTEESKLPEDVKQEQHLSSSVQDNSPEEIYWLSYAQFNSKPDLSRDAAISRPRCATDADCSSLQSSCEQREGRCHCPEGYYPKEHQSLPEQLVARHAVPSSNVQSVFCMRAAGYGEPCISSQQCIVNNSICAEPPGHWTSTELAGNGLTKLCLCREGYYPGCK